MNIFLIGYRCTGKTSVGKALAKRLALAFEDADDLLVEKEGKPIAEVVAECGWDYFRVQEKAILQFICSRDRQVVATGGGVILDPDNVTAMKNCGVLVWLQAETEAIRQRMLADEHTPGQRPALTGRSAGDEIETTLAERTPLYRAAMDFTVDTDGYTIEGVCDLIVKRFEGK